jgi:putative ABC transport system substrate-binding protein
LDETSRQGLRDLGYVEGQDLAVEYRWSEGEVDRFPELAAERVARLSDLFRRAAPQSILIRVDQVIQ